MTAKSETKEDKMATKPKKNADPPEFDVEISMNKGTLTLVVVYGGQTRKYPVTPEAAEHLGDKLKAGAGFLKK